MPKLNRTGRKVSNKPKAKVELGSEEITCEIQQAIREAKKNDSGKKPLRVDRNTIILVHPSKANREYINEFNANVNRI